MKVAIISDIHNNITNLKKVLDYCAQKNIRTIICCGDLASLETLDFLNDNFQGEIHYAFGNMDNDYLQEKRFSRVYKKSQLYEEFGETEIDGKKIAFIHFPPEARELCATGKYNIVFYGHTHKPWEEMVNECKLLNPGNVAGEIYPPTFAVWDTESDRFELVRIHGI